MQEFIDLIFNVCVDILQVIGNVTGMGYNLANLVIFVVIQPLLILIFFYFMENREKEKFNQYFPTKKYKTIINGLF